MVKGKKRKVKIVKVSKRKSERNVEKRKKDTSSRKSKKIFTLIVIIFILILLNSGIKTIRWVKLAKEMANLKNSTVIDNTGAVLANIGEARKTEYKSSENIPSNLKKAYVAIEDQRFYSHIGIDVKRTGGAILTYIRRFGKSSFGGSTITQQLVKNLTGDSDRSISRKVAEWGRAITLDTVYSKDEILTLYLNIIYVGPNSYGVGAGAKYYFDKDVSELSIAECAFMAGINNSPNSYKPFENTNEAKEKIKKRSKTVLGKMLELEFIDQSQYDEAVSAIDAGLKFKQGNVNTGSGNYSYHTDALINECVSDIAEKYKISDSFALNYLQLSGSKIFSTVDSSIQNEVNNEMTKSKYILRSSLNPGDTSQAAMVIIEPNTGMVLACTGGLGEKKVARGLNRATQSTRQTGSSIKPLSVLIPGLNEKVFTASTIYDDVVQEFEPGYSPGDYNQPLGNITVRRALESSQNIPFILMIKEIGLSKSIDYLKEMGITSLTKDDESLTLALGGFVNGITPLEMAGAYNTIANNGVYIEPTFYKKIDKNNGKTFLKSKQTSKRIIGEDVASLLQNLLQQPVLGNSGTATYCKINGVDVCAKTGTSDENYDRWLCGFTPYYTAVTWFGFDKNESINFNKRNPAGLIWANVMHRIHAGKESRKFEINKDLQAYKICAKTGERARTNCNNPYVEYYLKGTVPAPCKEHTGNEIEVYIEVEEETKKPSLVNKVIETVTTDIDAVDPQEIQDTSHLYDSTTSSETTEIEINDTSQEESNSNQQNEDNTIVNNIISNETNQENTTNDVIENNTISNETNSDEAA